ncbi:MAG: alpha-2-macroglobulin, partial [Variovorax sp.]|nr:alpha-2-macroglobulin [Variovorax sp.]
MNRLLSTLALSAGVLLATLPLSSHALQITSLTPQGEVARVRQIVAKFDQPAVKFGDPKAPAPLAVSCTDAAAGKGTGRWTGEKQWVYDFENDLPPGVRCTVTRIADFKSGTGADMTGPERYQFNSGGPFVRNVQPGYGKIDEQQLFALELSGPATLASVRQNIWCAVDGVGERVPVRLIEGADRTGLLKSFGQDKAAEKEPLRFVTMQCNRTLTPASRVQIVYGKGVATP